MARNGKSKVYLGYEDEFVTEKHRSMVNFTTNKIGGKPDWHNEQMTLSAPQCRLCGLHQLLALQIYAPLDNSKYHRTLYIFACMNPNCWNQNESWTCLRVQSLEQATNSKSLSSSCATVQSSATSWLPDADDWGDNWNDNISERNGNNLLLNDPNQFCLSAQNTNYEEELKADFSELQVDDPNANSCSPTSVDSPVGVGAVGRLDSPHASAEIEGEESEVVCIDTPTKPHCDLISLLQEVTPPPVQHTESKGKTSLFFNEIFISVDEEYDSVEVLQHERDLFLEYQRSNPDDLPGSDADTSQDSKGYDIEKYEKSVPKHGDQMYYNFTSRIQKNPGQILRYARDNSAPLLLYPMGGCIGRCRHCGDEMTFELQVLPTLIRKLKLNSRSDRDFQLEFGTILIFTCIRSCWSATDSYREEHVIVQAERLQFKT